MGYMRHHAIVVSSWNEAGLNIAHKVACSMFKGVAPVTEITKPTANGYVSFMIAPDGSKEGWPPSDDGDWARHTFKEWMREQKKLYASWTEVQFGDENGETMICDHSDVVKEEA